MNIGLLYCEGKAEEHAATVDDMLVWAARNHGQKDKDLSEEEIR